MDPHIKREPTREISSFLIGLCLGAAAMLLAVRWGVVSGDPRPYFMVFLLVVIAGLLGRFARSGYRHRFDPPPKDVDPGASETSEAIQRLPRSRGGD